MIRRLPRQKASMLMAVLAVCLAVLCQLALPVMNLGFLGSLLNLLLHLNLNIRKNVWKLYHLIKPTVKEPWVLCSLYYLTFTAKDKNIVDVGKEQNIKTYRAKVWRKPDNDLVLEYFAEFKPPQKKAGKQEAVTPHKAKIGGKSSNRSKKLSKGKQGPAAGSGCGRLLAGFHAIRKELKEKNPSWTHSQAMGAASKLWKSMSSAEEEEGGRK